MSYLEKISQVIDRIILLYKLYQQAPILIKFPILLGIHFYLTIDSFRLKKECRQLGFNLEGW